MALGLEVKGMINIQYIVRDEHVYVIEVNPRSSRTVPFLSKITGISMVDVATRCAMGMSLKEQGLQAVYASSRTTMLLKLLYSASIR